MRKKQLEITKDNYKGYLELYKLKTEHLTIWQEIIKSIWNLGSFTLALIVTIVLTKNVTSIEVFFGILASIGIAESIFITLDMKKFFKRKKLKKLKEEYPYLDLNSNESNIEKAFKKVNKGKTTIDTKKWENYYACEEIRKKTLTGENRKYQPYIYEFNESEISSKEIKQKVKVLVKTK